MRNTRTARRLAALLLLASAAAVAALSRPAATAAFSTYGESLGLDQRDFRVRNNFQDPTANDNVVAQPMFPGQVGAPLAIWKAHVEWSSGPWAGTGAGDGLSGGGVGENAVLGSGAANFDNTFQGVSEQPGGPNSNVHTALDTSSSSLLAFTTLPISDGWKVFYYESWTWDDGPGVPAAGLDLQGVATHEIGHTLGLGHTTASGATMQPAISGTGTGARSIAADDSAGVQFIYGAKAAAKPLIQSLAGSTAAGGTLQVLGQNFAATGNEAWFTNAAASGEPVKLTGLPSLAGGTRVDVIVPAGAANGEVLVRVPGSDGAALSNAFPIDIVPWPVVPAGLAPAAGPVGGYTEVEIGGSGLLGVSAVRFGGVPALALTVVSDTLLRATTPPAAATGLVDVELVHSEGVVVMPAAFTYVPDPPPELATVTPASGAKEGGTLVTLSGATLLGVSEARFGGVPGTQLALVDAGHLTVVTPPGVPGPVDVDVSAPTGSATLPGAFTYANLGDVVPLGPGLGGWLGVPELTGTGDLTAGSAVGFTLTLSHAFPLAMAHLFLGLDEGALPFKGGTLYPVPVALDIALATGPAGELLLVGNVPAGTPPGSEVVLQAWIADPVAPAGWSASNGLLLRTP